LRATAILLNKKQEKGHQKNMHRKSAITICGILGALLAACQPAPFMPELETVDLLIRNARVVDGSGEPAIKADVVIAGDKIVFVGDAAFTADDLQTRIKRRIDAAGRVLAPGFIDLHSHGDPLDTPELENFLAMGVTTISLGQDGSSPDTADLAAWLDAVRDKGIGTNLAMFVGHGTLRNLSGIGRSPQPEPEQMQRMLSMLDRTLEYTFGMTTGLEYNPGLNASEQELVALAEIAGKRDRVIMSHMRNEDDDQIENSIAELLEQGRYARVHISHLKSVYGKGSERAEQILTIIDNARAAGIEVTADMYPYTASYTGIGIVFPVWAKTREQFEVARRERRAELAEYLRNRVMARNGPESTLLGTDPWTGKTLAELSFELELPFEDVLIDVIGPDGASGAYFVMNEELQTGLLQSPWVGVCSDGSPTGFHPRGHGTFAKIIEQYVVRDEVLSLEEAIAKMTSFPARILRIPDRGRIEVGMRADLVLFDPANVRANATYPEPLQFANGFDLVVVNGVIAREKGRLSERRAGEVLRPAP
jgi:N-acyl-D-aspartate/D-glutamate deacylase